MQKNNSGAPTEPGRRLCARHEHQQERVDGSTPTRDTEPPGRFTEFI